MRLLMIAVTLSAIACYWAFIRPTSIAQRFVSAVQENNYQQAEAFCVESNNRFLSETLADIGDSEVKVRILPRKWGDVWKLQRRVSLQVIPKEPRPNSKLLVGCQSDLVATAGGIRPPIMYPVTFGP
jgi:hypothetical protein